MSEWSGYDYPTPIDITPVIRARDAIDPAMPLVRVLVRARENSDV